MADLHALLRRQLRKHFGSAEVPESLRAFIERVNETYLQADDDRRLVERAFNLSSQELLDANAELAAAVAALGQAAEQTAQASRAKDEFLAMLGHELRNPLAPIVTSLDVARLRGVTSLDARDLEGPVRQVLRLVDDLLDIARVARGALVLEKGPLEVCVAVRNAAEAIQPALEQRRHVLEVDVPADGLAVDGDEARLTQVVSNLLMNSVRYTEPGGIISVTVAATATRSCCASATTAAASTPTLSCTSSIRSFACGRPARLPARVLASASRSCATWLHSTGAPRPRTATGSARARRSRCAFRSSWRGSGRKNQRPRCHRPAGAPGGS